MADLKDNLPLISVIIPIYNHSRFIEKCLNSVINDNYPNKEMVIINDGSTDNSDTVIKNWIGKNEDKIQITYRITEKQGLSKTLNELVKISQGEYLVNLSGNYCLKNNSIRKRFEYLINNPDKLAVIGNCEVIDKNNNILYSSTLISNANKKTLLDNNKLKRFVISNSNIQDSTILAHRLIFDVTGPYDENLSSMGWIFCLKAVSKNLLCFTDEVVCRTSAKNKYSVLNRLKITKEHKKAALKYMPLFKGLKYKYYFIRKILLLQLYQKYLEFILILNYEDKISTEAYSRFFRLLQKTISATLIYLKETIKL